MKKYHQTIKSDDFTFRRCFEMPNSNTFQLKCVKELLSRHIDISQMRRYRSDKTLSDGKLVVIDPFSRLSYWSTWTNDLNPRLDTDFHMESREFLKYILSIYGENFCDIALLDAPYSPRQISECYKNIGRKVTQTDTQIATLVKECKDLLDKLLKTGGKAICFGWNTMGFGKTRGYKMIEILDITHGGMHNDSLCTVEIKK